MIHKRPLIPERLRTIQGSFAYIEHRLFSGGFFTALSHHELLLRQTWAFLLLLRYGGLGDVSGLLHTAKKVRASSATCPDNSCDHPGRREGKMEDGQDRLKPVKAYRGRIQELLF